MPSHKSLVTSHESPVKGPNSFRITYICKNASANPYGSHTYKTKDLKPFRITYLQKKGGGSGVLSNLQTHPSSLRSSLTPLDSALTSKRVSKSFTCNTYEKHTQGEGGLVARASACVPTCLSVGANHESQVTSAPCESRFHRDGSPVTSHNSRPRALRVPLLPLGFSVRLRTSGLEPPRRHVSRTTGHERVMRVPTPVGTDRRSQFSYHQPHLFFACAPQPPDSRFSPLLGAVGAIASIHWIVVAAAPRRGGGAFANDRR